MAEQGSLAEAFRLEALTQEISVAELYRRCGKYLGDPPLRRMREFYRGMYRLSPSRMVRYAQAAAMVLPDMTPEAVIRWMRADREKWLEKEKAMVLNMDSPAFKLMLRRYLARELKPKAEPEEILEEAAES